MSRAYIGLDTAAKLGYAAWRPEDNLAQVALFKGEPIEQVVEILDSTRLLFKEEELLDVVFVMEMIHSFQNAVTTRSLLERYGYIKHTLRSTGFPVVEVSPSPVRHFLGAAGKREVYDLLKPYYKGERLRDDHTDALACALFRSNLDGYEFKLDDLVIQDIVKEMVHE